MKRRGMMIAALLAAGMLLRAVGMESTAEGSVSGGDVAAEGTVSGGDAVPAEDPALEKESVSGGDAVPMAEPGIASLQIPQKLNVVLDPWEMDGREQIYSEQYTIQNTGSAAGILRLSFRCVVPEGSEVVIQSDKERLHEGETKSIYIEVIFGEDRIVLSQEDSEYQTELEPGETLQVSFSGGMNASASEPWQNGDIEIEGIYSWDPVGSTGEAIVNQEG